MAHTLKFPKGITLGDQQHFSGRKAVVQLPDGDDGSMRAEEYRVLEEPGNVEKHIRSVRMRVRELVRPHFGSLAFMQRRAFDRSATVIEIEVAPDRTLMMRPLPSEEGMLLWSDDPSGTLTEEMVRQHFPHAGSVRQRGNAWVATELLALLKPENYEEDVPAGETIEDPAQVLRIHERARIALLQKLEYGTLESPDPGMRILDETQRSWHVQWATINEQGSLHSLVDLQTSEKTVGWMAIVPHDNALNEEMQHAYKFRYIQGTRVPLVLVKSCNFSQEWAGICDARFRVHLHDVATRVESARGDPTADDKLIGDLRGLQAMAAAAELLSDGKYYAILDAFIEEQKLTIRDVVQAIRSPSSTFQQFFAHADAAISEEPPRSNHEQSSRGGVHLSSLALRIFRKEGGNLYTREAGIRFMKQMRREASVDSFDAGQN